MNNNFHKSILINEVLEFLQVKAGSKYIDVTIGGGGHTSEILAKGGRVLGIDWDFDAIEFLKNEFATEIGQKRLILEKANFTEIKNLAEEHNFINCAGIIFDLGVSKHQLETSARGLSFQILGPLDMRMNKDLQVTAKDLLVVLSQKELTRLFSKFSEKKAYQIAAEIARIRKITPIETTLQLANLVRKIVKAGKLDPATKVFLAIRTAVNFELENLKEALPRAFQVLVKSGRLLVISFHSAEDGIVKQFFRQPQNLAILTPKPIKPTDAEILANPSARSAKLRVGEKIL